MNNINAAQTSYNGWHCLVVGIVGWVLLCIILASYKNGIYKTAQLFGLL
jgi:hypothetical protein